MADPSLTDAQVAGFAEEAQRIIAKWEAGETSSIRQAVVQAHRVLALLTERVPLAGQSVVTCAWTPDEDGVWETGCGHRWEFTTGGPRDNHCTFCPYCGGRLVVVSGWVCAECGPGPVKVDEDGCCAHCGADARLVEDTTSVAVGEEQERGRG